MKAIPKIALTAVLALLAACASNYYSYLGVKHKTPERAQLPLQGGGEGKGREPLGLGKLEQFLNQHGRQGQEHSYYPYRKPN